MGRRTREVSANEMRLCEYRQVKPASPYLVQGEGAHAEGGQLNGVQQGHLGHAVGLCASAGPVLVALDLQVKRKQTGKG